MIILEGGEAVIGAVLFIAGLLIGFHEREIQELRDKLHAVKEPLKSGVTKGAYREVSTPVVTKGKDTGIVQPKTPKLVEFEAMEDTVKHSKDWGIKP